MFEIMIDVETSGQSIIIATFADGTKKRYDMKPLIEEHEAFGPLKDIALFNQLRVEAGGYGIVWNEDIDIAAEEIWYNGDIIF